MYAHFINKADVYIGAKLRLLHQMSHTLSTLSSGLERTVSCTHRAHLTMHSVIVNYGRALNLV